MVGVDWRTDIGAVRAAVGDRVALQGNMSQNQRQKAINGFRNGTYDILVATDIAARGIDVSEISHVINFDMPDTVDAYTHRIGRTGRSEPPDTAKKEPEGLDCARSSA